MVFCCRGFVEAYRDLQELVCKVPLGSQVWRRIRIAMENSLHNQSNRYASAVFRDMSHHIVVIVTKVEATRYSELALWPTLYLEADMAIPCTTRTSHIHDGQPDSQTHKNARYLDKVLMVWYPVHVHVVTGFRSTCPRTTRPRYDQLSHPVVTGWALTLRFISTSGLSFGQDWSGWSYIAYAGFPSFCVFAESLRRRLRADCVRILCECVGRPILYIHTRHVDFFFYFFFL